MTRAERLRLASHPDRRLLWERGGSVRYLAITVEACPAAASSARERPPHSLGLVLDASPSMTEEALARAKAAAEGIVVRLGNADRLSIVSFAEEIHTHLAAAAMDAAGRAQAVAALRSVVRHQGNRTAARLVDGWLRGAELVAADLEARPDALARVFLFSDGRSLSANEDLEELESDARGLEARGLSTAVFRLGVEVSPAPLIALDYRRDLPIALTTDVDDLARLAVADHLAIDPLAAIDLQVRVAPPRGVATQNLSELGRDPQRRPLTVELGDLRAGGRRRSVVKLVFPRGVPGEEVAVGVGMRWRDPGDGLIRQGPDLEARFVYAVARDNSAQERDAIVAGLVSSVWVDAILRRGG